MSNWERAKVRCQNIVLRQLDDKEYVLTEKDCQAIATLTLHMKEAQDELARYQHVATVQLDSSGISDNPKFVRYFGAGWQALPVGTKLYALKESSDEIALPEIKQRATTKMRVGKVKNLESSDEQS